MKRTFFGLMCLAVLLCLTLTASAEPAISRGGYTAYLGQANYLYLQDPLGDTKYMTTPIVDIIDVTDSAVFCLSQDGRLIRINLEGTQSSVVAAQPTQEQIDEVKNAPMYHLEGTTLTLNDGSATGLAMSTTALAVSANSDTLYWIEAGLNGTTTLKSLLLDDPNAIVQVIGDGVTTPLSLIATDESLAMVAGDRTITVVNLQDRSRNTYPATLEQVVSAVAIDGKLYRYNQGETGHFTTSASVENLSTLSTLSALNTVTTQPTYSVGSTSTATPPPATTVRPTATVRPSTSTSSSSSSYASLKKGSTGSDVRKMQKRLSELGYPVGKVDGVWGDDTQLAVNLFQCAIGYTERTYATSSMLDKLYGKKAPKYDPCAPLKKGEKGTDVRIMQTTLQLMGYDPGTIDGVYGDKTAAAVKLFQKVAGLKQTGTADKDTLKLLYSADCPLNPDVYPTATPKPTEKPTEKPTQKPTEKPTDKPTEKPTATPAPKTQIKKVTIVYDKTKEPLKDNEYPEVGDKLTVITDPKDATVTYKWHYENEKEVLSTEAVYTVSKDDLGKKLVCTVTGTGDYTGTVDSEKVVATPSDLKK